MAKGFSVFVAIGAKLLPSLNASATGVEKRFAEMNRRLRVQAAETKVALKEMGAAWGSLAGLAAAGGLSAGFKGILGEGAEYQHQIAQMKIMGRTSKEVAQAIAAAHRTMADVPTSSLNDSLKILNETTLAFGGIQHAMENLSFNQRMGALMKGIMGDGYDEAGGFNQLVRALELRGGKLSTADYQRQASALFQAMATSGGTVNPENILGFMQQAGPAARGYSESFLTHVIPSLIQEFGGERSGTMATALYNQFNGRTAIGGKALTQEWVRLGLVPKKGTGGNLSTTGWTAGTLKGYGLAMSDPLQYIEQVMMPAMRAKGIDTNNAAAMRLEVQKLFGRETAKRLADTLFNPAQLARINADMKLYDRASGVDKAYSQALYNDPRMAGMAAANSLHNLETTMGKSVWNNPTVIKAIVSLAGGINSLAEVFDKHPVLAQMATFATGFGAFLAIMKLFGAPIGFLLRPLGKLIGLLWRAFGPAAFRLFLAFGTRLLAFAPVVGEAIMGVFALISNPLGWTILAVLAASIAIAFVVQYRKQIGAWFKKSWASIKATFLSVDWASVGTAIAWAIADALSFGLASKMPAIASGLKGWWSANAPTWAGGAPAPIKPLGGLPKPNVPTLLAKPTGARAGGGPVLAGRLYRINERGDEGFIPTTNGKIIPHSEVQRRRAARGGGGVTIGDVHIHGANDPESTRRILRQELHRMAMGNTALLSD